MVTTKTSSKQDAAFQNYVVVFLDVLGQSSKLQLLRAPPWTPNQRTIQIAILKETVGTIRQIRETFRQAFAIRTVLPFPDGEIPTELQKLFDDAAGFDLVYWGVSDSSVIAVPLGMPEESIRPISGIQRTLQAAAAMMAGALADGFSLRGGIDLGPSLEIEEGEVYGLALERAYRLESRVAEYPRIVVGSELVTYIRSWATWEPTTLARRIGAEIAKQTEALLTKDTDGFYVVDYLGKGMEFLGDDFSKVYVAPGYAKAKMARASFAEQADQKLEARWQRVVAYYESKLRLWGIPSSEIP